MSDKNRNTTQTDPEAARLPATFQGLTAIITQLSIDVANERGARAVAVGLQVEHQMDDLVVWGGEDGEVYMFQSELYAKSTAPPPTHRSYCRLLPQRIRVCLRLPRVRTAGRTSTPTSPPSATASRPT